MGVIGFAEAVDSFAAALALERGLAEKTQEAYLRDVRALVRFLRRLGIEDAAAASRERCVRAAGVGLVNDVETIGNFKINQFHRKKRGNEKQGIKAHAERVRVRMSLGEIGV